jgi:NAD(P)H dehydrogenase (quinone)
MQEHRTLLVTGASGQLGRSVLGHLLDTHRIAPVRIVATTRTPDQLQDLARRGVHVRKADFDAPAGLEAAFGGAQRALIISTDRVGVPGERLAQHRAAVAAIEAAGVEHVVYTSMMHPDPDSPVVALAPDHFGTEQALGAARFTSTILRNCWYTDFLLLSLPPAIAAGTLLTAAGGKGVVYVTREDCARACAGALAAETREDQTLDVTGPDAVSHQDLARIASELTGKSINVVELSDDELRKSLVAAGLPAPVADLTVSIDINTRRGNTNRVSDAVQRLTGAPPQSVLDFLTASRSALG